LQNGELPDTLDATVFWLLIGTNDLGADLCSAEAVAAGNIRIIEEIRSRRPNAKIVLNSILPRSCHIGDDIYKKCGFAWETAAKLNYWMACYAETSEHVEFFNATSLFLKDNERIQI
jgi:hypothetical protein